MSDDDQMPPLGVEHRCSTKALPQTASIHANERLPNARLIAALAKAQGLITGARKDSANPFFNSRYADLASCWDACREALSANGLAVVQTTERGESVTIEWETTDQASGEISRYKVDTQELVIVTHLLHESGESIVSRLPLIPRDASPQGIGSAITYGRRYGLCAMVGIAQVDDDGNAQSHARPQQSGTRPPRAAPEPTPEIGSTKPGYVAGPKQTPGRPVTLPPKKPAPEMTQAEVERAEGLIVDAKQELLEAAAEGRRVGITQIWGEIKGNEFVAQRVWKELKLDYPDYFRTIEETLKPKDAGTGERGQRG